jgi:hypothetical protein
MTRGSEVKNGLRVEELEDRVVPSGMLDLTTRGAIGEINGALFRQADPQPTGTGVIRSFVRLQTSNGKAVVEQGYNTDARPLQFDENKSPQFTRSLQLGDLPTVDVDGVIYRVFLLDINQKSSQPYLSLDELRFYVGSAPNLTGYNATTHQLPGASPVYDLGDSWVKLDYRLDSGSGSGDMLLYVPDSVFGASGSNPYVYLYSKFGVNFAGNSGFEEWAPAALGQLAAGGSISGTVYLNGVAAPNQTVFIDTNGNGILDANEVYTTTDANGNYTFNDLATGMGDFSTYTVRVLVPNDWTQTYADANLVALLTANQSATNVNFNITTQTPPPGSNPGDQPPPAQS